MINFALGKVFVYLYYEMILKLLKTYYYEKI